MYEHLCVVGFKGLDEEQTLNILLENDVDVVDIETNNDLTVVYGNPQDLYKIKESISNNLKDVEFNLDEVTYIAKEKVELSSEELEVFNKLLTLLDDVEDVANVYHNVSNI